MVTRRLRIAAPNLWTHTPTSEVGRVLRLREHWDALDLVPNRCLVSRLAIPPIGPRPLVQPCDAHRGQRPPSPDQDEGARFPTTTAYVGVPHASKPSTRHTGSGS